jgi:hypothetical protein
MCGMKELLRGGQFIYVIFQWFGTQSRFFSVYLMRESDYDNKSAHKAIT